MTRAEARSYPKAMVRSQSVSAAAVLPSALACDDDIRSARSVLETEAAGLRALAASLGGAFADAVEQIAAISGRVVVSGMGKSGHVARKIAAALAST